MDSIKRLGRIVQANIGLSKPRQTCLAAMVVGIVQARTVNLKRVCQSCSSIKKDVQTKFRTSKNLPHKCKKAVSVGIQKVSTSI